MSRLRQVPLGEVVRLKKGISYTSNDYGNEDNGIPFITIKCFKKGGGYEKTGLKYFKGTFNESDALAKDDVLFSVTDLTRAGDIVGSPLKVPDFGKDRRSLASMDLMKVEPKGDECISDYIYYCLMNNDVRRKMVAYSAGSTVLHLDTNRVPEFIVTMPKVAYQRKISRILSTVDAAIEKTEAAIEKYKAIKQGMTRDLFSRGIDIKTGKLRPRYEDASKLYRKTKLGWLPKEWEVLSVEQFASQEKNAIVDGPFGSNLKTIHYKAEGIPIIQSGFVTNNEFHADGYLYVTKEKFLSEIRSKVSPGDIVMAKIGAQCGTSAILPKDHPISILAGNCLKITVSKINSNKFFEHYLHHLYETKMIFLIISTTAQPAVSMSSLKVMPVIRPSYDEQIVIEQKISSVSISGKREVSLLQKYQYLKQALMSDLLTGRVPVKVEEKSEIVNA